MAQWLKRDNNQAPAELLDFNPEQWCFGASNSASRLTRALDLWYEARWSWIMEDPRNRTIDGDDVVDLVYEDTR